MWWMLRELKASLADAWEHGDLVGHLKAWWSIVWWIDNGKYTTNITKEEMI
jgi:hypothetical protein